MKVNDTEPGADLYNRVRAGFIIQGSNLSSWCKEQGTHPSNAKACLVGMWGGPKSKALRDQLVKASGISSLLNPNSNSNQQDDA